MDHFPHLHTLFLPAELKVFAMDDQLVDSKKKKLVFINIAVTVLLKIA